MQRILVVDDEANVLSTLTAVLERAGYHATAVRSARDAVRELGKQQFDVVVSDLVLDGTERGLEVLQAARASSPATEVIILTGNASTATAIQALRDGAFHYLIKPCNVEELLLTVERALEKRQLERRAHLAQRAEISRAEAVRARRRMARLFERAPALIASCRGPRHRLEFANHAFMEILGGSAGERDLEALLPWAGAERVLELLDEVRRTGQPIAGREIAVRRPAERGAAEALYFNFVLEPSVNEKGRTQGIFIHGVDVTEQVRGRQRVSHLAGVLAEQALHDSLTDLPNRRLFFDRLQQAIRAAQRNRRQLGLLFLDLDGFKNINDTLGHEVGDVVLQRVGEAIRVSLRSSDTVGRLGGDEFAVLLPDLDSRAGATAVARKVRARLRKPLPIDGNSVEVRVSIGIALYPEDGRDVTSLMRHADSAMYAEKRGERRRRPPSRRTA